ncbi:NAD(P)/FAD-dependent oxidoreductase [Stakelama saccharophila]|uniref:FAD-dependent oxidoreductase n=1 Tax=Stakelama saccharophila TaxID=3075605 RepID=A0ABZ0B888_9SPHN|nr:FAD-dependent oxidoreductase [Stakelama sp. W311]WNO53326.1 FAD-dependent oxidoreductase [Stakelama sp. W311]
MNRYDIVIVGAGMAGASLAAAIGDAASVLLIEAEDQPGYHATGRSAAFWSETYGGPGVQPLTTASGPFLNAPPPEYGGESFLLTRGELIMGRGEDAELLDGFERRFAGSGVALRRSRPRDHVPGILPAWNDGLWGPSCADIDVARLHAACLKQARRQGVALRSRAELVSAARQSGGWALELADGGQVGAAVLVDAAGAWADAVARLADVRPLGIQPYRRTVVQVRVDPPAPADLPLVSDVRGGFYFKPEPGGRLWLSPHDETPTDPCDAAPEEFDVALAIDRLQHAVDWRIAAVERKWAGLRSFAPDRLPVYGFAPDTPGFFWFAGQGGFGIQTAPAAARLGAALLLNEPARMAPALDPERYAPARF